MAKYDLLQVLTLLELLCVIVIFQNKVSEFGKICKGVVLECNQYKN